MATQTITELAMSFPSLRKAPGIEPWEPIELLRWAATIASHGERASAQFVLGVWNPTTDWDHVAEQNKIIGNSDTFLPFDLFDAVMIWDAEHVAAVVKWMQRPFFP